MPSSSDEVATRPRSRPALSASSISTRCGARQRAMVRADQRLAGQLVERRGQALGDAAAVDEDQRRAVRAHQLQQARMDRGPDRRPRRALRRRAARDVDRLGRAAPCPRPAPRCAARSALRRAGVDDGDRARRRRRASRAGELVARSRRRAARRRAPARAGRRRPRRRRSRGSGAGGAPSASRRRRPPRKRATSSSGRCVADSPMRCERAARPAPRGAPSTAPGARRAWSAPARGSRRRSACRRCGTPRARSRSAAGTATPAS